MIRTITAATAAAVFLLAVAAQAPAAAREMQAPEPAGPGVYVTLGLFIPYEGDMDPGPAAGLGLEYAAGGESLFGEVLFSNLDTSLATPDETDNWLFTLGYKTDFGKWRRAKLGAGLTVHRIDLGSNVEMTSVMPMLLGEYTLRGDWLVQLKATAEVKSGATRHGGYIFGVLYNF